MPADRSFLEIFQQLDRLGLPVEDIPSGVQLRPHSETVEEFVERLRELPEGAGWPDVFPHLPAPWNPSDPAAWQVRYDQFGDGDFPASRTAPFVPVRLPAVDGEVWFAQLIEDARRAGHAVVGLVPTTRSDNGQPSPARVACTGPVTLDALSALADWLGRRDVTFRDDSRATRPEGLPDDAIHIQAIKDGPGPCFYHVRDQERVNESLPPFIAVHAPDGDEHAVRLDQFAGTIRLPAGGTAQPTPDDLCASWEWRDGSTLFLTIEGRDDSGFPAMEQRHIWAAGTVRIDLDGRALAVVCNENATHTQYHVRIDGFLDDRARLLADILTSSGAQRDRLLSCMSSLRMTRVVRDGM